MASEIERRCVVADIVARLAHMAWLAPEGEPWVDAMNEAADEIERLRAEVQELREAYGHLRPRVPLFVREEDL